MGNVQNCITCSLSLWPIYSPILITAQIHVHTNVLAMLIRRLLYTDIDVRLPNT
jgi:hypothetical protein